MSSFKKRYPDFASIETQIRRAHAERQVAIATAFADGIIAGVRGISRLFSAPTAAPVKAAVQGPARV
jgi:hypothetical protein